MFQAKVPALNCPKLKFPSARERERERERQRERERDSAREREKHVARECMYKNRLHALKPCRFWHVPTQSHTKLLITKAKVPKLKFPS